MGAGKRRFSLAIKRAGWERSVAAWMGSEGERDLWMGLILSIGVLVGGGRREVIRMWVMLNGMGLGARRRRDRMLNFDVVEVLEAVFATRKITWRASAFSRQVVAEYR